MINNSIFYNKHVKNCIIAFGKLFSDIRIIRENPNDQTKNQTLVIPISYAPKEKWLIRIEQDPELTNNVYTVLPVMSFDIQGFDYDSSRKLNRMNKVSNGNNSLNKYVHTGVPYNLQVTLYIITKTQEDNLQIIEQILPVFTPEYTVKYNNFSDPNIIEDLPIILNSVSSEDDYDGDFLTRRFITTTLSFTLKINLYGTTPINGIIKTAAINLGEDPTFVNPNETWSTETDKWELLHI